MKGLSVEVERDRERWHISQTLFPKVVCYTRDTYDGVQPMSMVRSGVFSSSLCHQMQITARECSRCMVIANFGIHWVSLIGMSGVVWQVAMSRPPDVPRVEL
jgi:hypothetical protein